MTRRPEDVMPFEQEQVVRVMTYRPPALETNATLAEAMALVEGQHVDILPVTREGAFMGVLTRQALRDTLEGRLRDEDASIATIMRPEAGRVSPDTSLSGALAVMAANRCDWLPVTIGALLIGVITRAGIMAALSRAGGRSPGCAAPGELQPVEVTVQGGSPGA